MTNEISPFNACNSLLGQFRFLPCLESAENSLGSFLSLDFWAGDLAGGGRVCPLMCRDDVTLLRCACFGIIECVGRRLQ